MANQPATMPGRRRNSPGQQTKPERQRPVLVATIGAIGAVSAAFLGLLAGNRGVGDRVLGEQPRPSTIVTSTVTSTVTAMVADSGDSTPPTATSDAQGSATGPADPRLETEVTLTAGSGVDLDRPKPLVSKASGPNGSIDLYWDGQSIYQNGGSLHPFYESEPSLDGCVSAMSKNSNYSGGVVAYVGTRMCFKTSSKRVSWLRFNDVHGEQGRSTLVLNVEVW